MRVLITGGAGFIGSHLAERLATRGDDVTIVDDLSTGSIHNVKALKTFNNFEYFIDSVTNERLMAELVDSADVIYHLAAAVGVKLIVESPTRTMETNIRGTEIVLELVDFLKVAWNTSGLIHSQNSRNPPSCFLLMNRNNRRHYTSNRASCRSSRLDWAFGWN
jgi:UDP-glucose 4-epimerase